MSSHSAKEVFTFLVGGKAGEGVRKAGSVAASVFAHMGRQVFHMDDYMSLIKGGHNFSVISTANRRITSQYARADLVVALDRRSYDMHLEHMADGGVLVYDTDAVKEGKGLAVPLLAEAKKYPNPKVNSPEIKNNPDINNKVSVSYTIIVTFMKKLLSNSLHSCHTFYSDCLHTNKTTYPMASNAALTGIS